MESDYWLMAYLNLVFLLLCDFQIVSTFHYPFITYLSSSHFNNQDSFHIYEAFHTFFSSLLHQYLCSTVQFWVTLIFSCGLGGLGFCNQTYETFGLLLSVKWFTISITMLYKSFTFYLLEFFGGLYLIYFCEVLL